MQLSLDEPRTPRSQIAFRFALHAHSLHFPPINISSSAPHVCSFSFFPFHFLSNPVLFMVLVPCSVLWPMAPYISPSVMKPMLLVCFGAVCYNSSGHTSMLLQDCATTSCDFNGPASGASCGTHVYILVVSFPLYGNI